MELYLKPCVFTKNLTITVMDYKTKAISHMYKVPVNEVAEKIPAYCEKFDIDKVLIAGNKNFTSKLGQSIQEDAINKYNLNLTIEYVK